ncbi:MAG: SEC-C domain-containing protein [Thermodesulfobacteriota bacterium]
MFNVGRNDPCPCGSGLKFKKCHMGREEELLEAKLQALPEDTARKISALPEVDYGRCRTLLAGLDFQKLSGAAVGLRFVDLKAYLDLGLVKEDIPEDLDRVSAGRMINPLKTLPADRNNIYVALSPAVSDSTLIHQLAHALDYLAGSKLNPALAGPLSLELEAPTELLEHPQEFGYWLTFLANELGVALDAEDTIVAFLYEKGYLIPGQTLASNDHVLVEATAKRTLEFLRRNRREIDQGIKDKAGYRPDAAPR